VIDYAKRKNDKVLKNTASGYKYMSEILASEEILIGLIDKTPYGVFCLLILIIQGISNYKNSKTMKAVFDDNLKSVKEAYENSEGLLLKEIQDLRNENRRLEDIVKERKGRAGGGRQ
jgi:hypothetical protein